MTFDLPRLARTALYRAAWGGRVPAGVDDAPPVSAWQWRRHVHERAARSLTTEPALWVLYPVPGDDPVWIPFAARDLETGAAAARQMLLDAGVIAGDAVVAVAPPAPWAGNTLPYLFSSADRLATEGRLTGVEVFPLSVTTVGYKADLAAFPLSRGPTVVAGSPGDVKSLLALARGAGQKPPQFRLALLVGPAALPAEESDLAESIASLLYLPGLFAPVGGRPDESGVRLHPDTVHAELIPDEEWGRSMQDPSRVPKVRPLPESLGDSGELVVTIANAALAVIRLRTSLRVRVADSDPATGIRIVVLNGMLPRAPETVAAFTPAPRR